MTPEAPTSAPLPPPPKRRGGRPKGAPEAVRGDTIGVRVSPAEYTALRTKSQSMGMTPAQWLREAALTRRLPSPPVAAINREQYAELGRLAGNLNQLTRLANEGRPVNLADPLIQRLIQETRRLRLALIGAAVESDIVNSTVDPLIDLAEIIPVAPSP